MSLRNAAVRTLLCAAALNGVFGLGEAQAAQDASPGTRRPAMRGLVLTLPDTQKKSALGRRAARPPENTSTDEQATLRGYLEMDPDSPDFAPIAGIVYTF